MKRLVNQEMAMEHRTEFPGSFKLWTEAARLGVTAQLRGGMPIPEAKDAIQRAEYARKAARALTHCQYAGERVPVGDFQPMRRTLKKDSPEMLATLNACITADTKAKVLAVAAIKRSVAAWPTCRFGGNIHPAWDVNGVCTWTCSHCN